MKLKQIKVHHLFWIVAAVILFIGIAIPDETLDILVHSTYFVISYRDAGFIFFVFYFLSGFGYWAVQKLLKKKLEKWLTIIHTVILIGSFVFYWLVALYYDNWYLINSDSPLFYDGKQVLNIILVLEFLLIVFVALPVYIVNILISIFKKNNQYANSI